MTPINELSISRFAAHMIAQQTTFPTPTDKLSAVMAPLLDMEIDELENYELTEYLKIQQQYSSLGQEFFDTLLQQEPISVFEMSGRTFRVQFINGTDDFYLKTSECIFINSMFMNSTKDKVELMLENLHLIAAILFREDGTDFEKEKFSESKVREIGELFLHHMQIKYIYPFNKILFEKYLNK